VVGKLQLLLLHATSAGAAASGKKTKPTREKMAI